MEPKIKYLKVEVKFVPQQYIYHVSLPIRVDKQSGYHVALLYGKLTIWYEDRGFATREYDLQLICSGEPIPETTTIIHATPNLLIGMREVKA